MSATNVTPPARSEAADYYFKYIDLVPAGDQLQILADGLRHDYGIQ